MHQKNAEGTHFLRFLLPLPKPSRVFCKIVFLYFCLLFSQVCFAVKTVIRLPLGKKGGSVAGWHWTWRTLEARER